MEEGGETQEKQTETEKPSGPGETHLVYTLSPRLFVCEETVCVTPNMSRGSPPEVIFSFSHYFFFLFIIIVFFSICNNISLRGKNKKQI